MTGIRRLAIFNALLDLVDDDGYQLTESIDDDDGIFNLPNVLRKRHIATKAFDPVRTYSNMKISHRLSKLSSFETPN